MDKLSFTDLIKEEDKTVRFRQTHNFFTDAPMDYLKTENSSAPLSTVAAERDDAEIDED